MTEQNRPGDESGNGVDRTGDAGAPWGPPAAAGPTPQPSTPPPADPAPADTARTDTAPSEPTGQPPTASPAAHQGWPPAGYGQQTGYGQPAGYGQPTGYGTAPGYGQHAGYGQPGPSTTGQPTAVQPGFGAFEPAGTATATLPPRRAGRWRLGVAGLVAGALIGGGAGAGVAALSDDSTVVTAGGPTAQSVVIKDANTATSATAAAAKAAPSVVTLYVSGGSSSGSGSGVILSADGYVLTNNHVVTLDSSTDSAAVQVRTADGTLFEATVVGTDPTSDLAVVKLKDAAGLSPATFADSGKVQVGDLAVAIGAPLGLSNTVTDGIISATNRAVATGSDTDLTVIDALQTDAAINPGNSGGALVDAEGQVVGINSAIATVASSDLPGQASSQSGNIGVGFAIPANTAKRIAEQIIDTGSATHALLGVSTRTAASDGNASVGIGAELAQVQPGSGAAAADLKVGDVVTAIGDRAVTTSTELTAAVRSARPGDTVTLTLRRGSGTTTVEVTLGESTN